MVRLRLTLALLLLASMAPVGAQAPPASTPLLEDPADDVAILAPAPASGPSQGLDAVDLLRLEMEETPTEIVVGLTVAGASGPEAVGGLLEYAIHFRHFDRKFRIEMRLFLPLGGAVEANAQLQAFDEGRAQYRGLVMLSATAEGPAWKIAVPREWLLDTQGAPPYPGRALDMLWVDAHAAFGAGGFGPATSPGLDVADRMPNTGEGPRGLAIQLGLAQSGHAILRSPEPFRTSNGEASTFVFRVNATNTGAEDDFFEFFARGVPQGWDVQVPGLMRIPGGRSVEVPVIVRTAFAHNHGTVADLQVEMQSQSDPGTVGRVALGLRYPAIPQPAGHHNQLYLHTIAPPDDPASTAMDAALMAAAGLTSVDAYFNGAPAEEDERDDEVPQRGSYCRLAPLDDNDTVGGGYCWRVLLDPGLEMGLDFDLTAQGTYSIAFSTLAPQPGARLQGTLRYVSPSRDPNDPPGFFSSGQTALATLDPGARVDMLVADDNLFTGTITPLPAADLVPYIRGGYLRLDLELRTNRPDNFYLGPKAQADLLPGGTFTLPLLEYEDPVDETFDGGGLVELKVGGANHRLANPGDTVLYNVTFTNSAGPAQDFELGLVGSNHAWGRIVGDTSFKLAKGESRDVAVIVAVPAEAVDGDRADLVVEAASLDSLEARALLRLVTTADTDAEHPDDATLLPSEGPAKSPTPAPGLALLTIVALGALLRRRRPS